MPFEVVRKKKEPLYFNEVKKFKGLLKPYQRRSLHQDLMKHIWESSDVTGG